MDDRVDGETLAHRLAAAVADGRGGESLSVVGEAEAVEATADGTRAYGIEANRTEVAEVFVHPDRVRVEFHAAPDEAATAATDAGLRVRPKAVRPPRTLVFVESHEDIERALDVVAAVAEATA